MVVLDFMVRGLRVCFALAVSLPAVVFFCPCPDLPLLSRLLLSLLLDVLTV